MGSRFAAKPMLLNFLRNLFHEAWYYGWHAASHCRRFSPASTNARIRVTTMSIIKRYFFLLPLIIATIPMAIYPVLMMANVMSIAGERPKNPPAMTLEVFLFRTFLYVSSLYPIPLAISWALALVYSKNSPRRALLISITPLAYLLLTVTLLMTAAGSEGREQLFGGMKSIAWLTNSRWHTRVGWNAQEYFNDEKVVALCHAIEQDDVPEMGRLIAAGANANAVGKDGMTPLLWAFPEGKLERFECLLKHGADPNVVFQSDFNTKNRPFHRTPQGKSIFKDRGCHVGQSVTLLSARSPLIEYLKLVLEHGGNPNQLDGKTEEAPLDLALDRYLYPTMNERVELLIAKGADVNRYCEYHKSYPAMEAVKNQRYGVALTLLKAGADPSLYQPDDVQKLTHFLVGQEQSRERQRKTMGIQLPELPPEYKALVEWLEQHGETLAQAREEQAELDTRFKEAFEPKDHERIRKKVIQERKQRVRGENKARGD
jgi:uncharacterized protein